MHVFPGDAHFPGGLTADIQVRSWQLPDRGLGTSPWGLGGAGRMGSFAGWGPVAKPRRGQEGRAADVKPVRWPGLGSRKAPGH